MADAHSKPNHDYHLVDPSPWPLIGSISAFLTAVGAIMWMKNMIAPTAVMKAKSEPTRGHGLGLTRW